MSDVLLDNIGIAPEAWDYDFACHIKTGFGVSAESFLYTLNDLKLIDPTCSEAIKKQIFAYYEASDYNEPGERYRRLNPNAAFMDLLHIARRGAQADPDRAKEIEKIGELIGKYGQGSVKPWSAAG